jgi:hypothetical protein
MESANNSIQKRILERIVIPALCRISFLFYFAVCFSCKQDEKGIKENTVFNNDLEIISLICYPNDSISLSFTINSTNGTAPYNYKWLNPDTLAGEGPFTIWLKNNLLLDVEIFDADQDEMEFYYEILKDTIDCVENDYRNIVTGLYNCEVIYHWTTQDPPGNFITNDSIFQDTIEISKDSDVKMLKISNFPDVNYYYRSSSFDGYHLSGYFRNDSISFYYFGTPVGLYNWTYKGKKIN